MIARWFLAALAATATLSANTIFSENFNNGVVGQVIRSDSSLGTDGNTPLQTGTQFEVISGSVDMITDADPYFPMCLTGTSCIDLTGSGVPRQGGEIRTVNEIYFEAGEYALSINLQGWQDPWGFSRAAEIQILLPGLLDVSLIRDGAHGEYPIEVLFFTVTTATSVKLTIRDISDSANENYGSQVSSFAGAILDDVEIARLGGDVAEVPEPSAYLLVAPFLVGLLISRTRRLREHLRHGRTSLD